MACKRTRGAPRLKQSWTYLRSTQHGASGNHEACFGMRAGGEDRSAGGPSTAWPRLRAKEDSSRVGVDRDRAEWIGKRRSAQLEPSKSTDYFGGDLAHTRPTRTRTHHTRQTCSDAPPPPTATNGQPRPRLDSGLASRQSPEEPTVSGGFNRARQPAIPVPNRKRAARDHPHPERRTHI